LRAALPLLDRGRTVAPAGYNRWLVPPAALAVHLSIGQVYAFSVFKLPMVTRFDTELTPISVIFSIAIAMLGLSAAIGGTWIERNGPRKAMALSATCWVSGFLIGALGVQTGQLWVVYLGYGVLGGIGLGIGYISPVSTLMKWFPDRPGLATGLAIMGFGGGALIASPLSTSLLKAYGLTATATPAATVDPIVLTFLTLAAIYGVLMALGAATVRVPAPGWRPEGWDPVAAGHGRKLQTTANVTAANAIRTPTFWFLWIVLFTNVTAGIGILEQASPMVQGFFGKIGPAEAAGFVGVLSLANMSGRFIWSSTSDVVGRKPIYMLYLGAGALCYLLLAAIGDTSPTVFIPLAAVILSFYGGGFATIPAYLKDLFGTVEVGAIHGRLLTAWSAAGIVGPMIVNRIADTQKAAGRSGLDLYSRSLYIMVGVLAVGFVANLAVGPVDRRYFEPTTEPSLRPALPAEAVA
jgi:MFS family permease